MSLVNLVRSVTFKVALGVGSLYSLGCDASSGSTQYCASDKDCKGDRLCVKGVCEGSGGSSENYNCSDVCDNIKYCCSTFSYNPEGSDVQDLCGPHCYNVCQISMGKVPDPSGGEAIHFTPFQVECLATTCGLSECYTGKSVKK